MAGKRRWRRILLIGPSGQVGWELCRTLAPLAEVIAVGRHTVPHWTDLTDIDSLRAMVREVGPDLIVNAAAYTAVDLAEEQPELAQAVNGDAPGILAEETKRLGAGLLHYSTDYVFDGTGQTPHSEDDAPNPLNVYGKTKLAGERAIQAVGPHHMILRASWVYGARGKNFLRTVLRLACEREELRIVDDQVGSPTWSRMIAETTAQILAKLGHSAGMAEHAGIYHMTSGGQGSWYAFTQEILFHANEHLPGYRVERLVPISTEDYPTPARRPLYSVLSNERLAWTFGVTIPAWPECLRLCMTGMYEA